MDITLHPELILDATDPVPAPITIYIATGEGDSADFVTGNTHADRTEGYDVIGKNGAGIASHGNPPG